ncbi:MAG: ABC transporter ATP-binding protein [Phenylobacterium sp.]|uniref:ABC transporter ATP-binding protein n=1 Tax=Phenylobacterium sp. TaxID=1871053 RepID=UPI00391BD20E
MTLASPASPEVSITVTDLTMRFPVYGVDAKSLKKHLARVTVGGSLAKSIAGATEVTAISNLNLKLRPGDRLGLIGHNGSGKTTLLRALSGAYEPDQGQIEVRGRIAALLDLSLGIDPSATGIDNIRLRGRIAGLSAREIESRMDEIAEFTGLGPFLAMPMKTYSAGMQARLAFAVATSVEADVLLMDEWIAVGDAQFQKLAHRRLLDLVERAGILVLASHEVDLLRLYCNKVMRMDSGVASPVMDIRKLDELMAA